MMPCSCSSLNGSPRPTASPIINALTIDVEDYFMVSAFADIIRFDDWGTYESRVERNTYQILNVLDDHDVKATFFVLGWVAEQRSKLIKDIYAAGHEIASHGYNHRLIYQLTPSQFRDDIRKSKRILEDITGGPVLGYRAASYSIIKKSLWALDILIEEGFHYDSSIFPIRHDRYGMPEAQRFPHVIKRSTGDIMEFPPSTLAILGQNVPVAGGGYLRLLPLGFIKNGIQQINREGRPAVIYFHPWEIDPGQPRVKAGLKSRFRHYVNLHKTLGRIKILLNQFSFAPFQKILIDERNAFLR